MNAIRGLVFVTAVLAVLFLAAACGGDDVTTPPVPTKVVLAAGSWGTAGDKTITVTTGVKYVVKSGNSIKGVKDDGSLVTTMSDAANLSGTKITGLTNGTTYDVYKLVTGTNGASTELDEDEYNTVVNISALSSGNTHVIKADTTKPAAERVIVYVEEAIVTAVTGSAIANNVEFTGLTKKWTLGSTTADNAEFLNVKIGDKYIVFDFSALSDGSFTTTITVGSP
jgi:hypothetical protein